MINNPYILKRYEIIHILPQTSSEITYRIACDIRPRVTVDKESMDWSGNAGLVTKYVPDIEIEDHGNIEVIIVVNYSLVSNLID